MRVIDVGEGVCLLAFCSVLFVAADSICSGESFLTAHVLSLIHI